MKEENAGMIRNLYTMVRSWASFRDLWNGGEKRNQEQEFGHPDVLSPLDYWTKFDRGDVAARVVSIYPEECFREPPEIYETEDAETDTEFEKAFSDLNDEMHLVSFLVRADILSGVGRFGVILLGVDDGKTLDAPIDGFPRDGEVGPVGGPGPVSNANGQARAVQPSPPRNRKLLYLRTFDESMVRIVQLEKEVANPRFGQPIIYEITLIDDDSSYGLFQGVGKIPSSSGVNKTPQTSDVTSARTTLKVHWTRIIHLADNRLRDEIFGTPRLKKVFDRILDLHKISGSSAEMFFKGALGLALETQPPLPGEAAPEVDEDKTKQELEEYYMGLKRYLVLNGLTAKSLGVQVIDPGPSSDAQLKLICSAIGCPMRVFLGSEEAKLASGQDAVSWNARLQKRRNEYLTPYVIRPFLDRLIKIGVLPFPKGDSAAGEDRPNYFIHWEPLESSSLTDEATIAFQKTQAMAQYVQNGVNALISPMMFLTLVLKFTQEEAKAIIDDIPSEYQADAETEAAAAQKQAEQQMAVEKIRAAAAGKATPGKPSLPAKA